VLEEFRSFLVILEEGSLRRAAERLHVSQPSLTRQMQLLEHDLGGRVLERTSAGVRPTNEGLALAEKARALLGYYEATCRTASFVSREEDMLRNQLFQVVHGGIVPQQRLDAVDFASEIGRRWQGHRAFARMTARDT
jgi:hypothetical protein